MISVEEALKIINNCKVDFGIENTPLDQSLGRILREDWYTDRDLPPYDRVTMDGIAIKYDQFLAGRRSFKVEGTAAAGMKQIRLTNDECCLEVMTGAVNPENTDVVIRYEDILIEDGVAVVQIDNVKHLQNIHFKGQDRKQGTLVVKKGTTISAAEIATGASIGKAMVSVSSWPKIMVISTGDELVEIDKIPESHQIRRSNIYAIQASLNGLGIECSMSHLLDDESELHVNLTKYIKDYDVLILSGGVSKGKFDYLPKILLELGVEKMFHRVKQRPGKPFWFGRTEDCTVFALPGNPISSFLCLEKYFKFWLEKCLSGLTFSTIYAELQSDVHFKPDLTYFLEVELTYDDTGRILALPRKGNGSGDLANLVNVEAFIELPKGLSVYPKGTVYPILQFK